jgi:hypothetical protein
LATDILEHGGHGRSIIGVVSIFGPGIALRAKDYLQKAIPRT